MTAPKAPNDQADISNDEPIIELSDPILPPTEEDAPVIELTDRVDAGDLQASGQTPLDLPTHDDAQPTAPEGKDAPGPQLGFEEAIQQDLSEEGDDFVDSLGLEIAPAYEALDAPSAEAGAFPPPSGDSAAQALEAAAGDGEAPALTSEKLEAALERVVEKIYAEKIEGILVETIERVVTREIERIKTVLTGDRDMDDER
jgi:hypothetical protein